MLKKLVPTILTLAVVALGFFVAYYKKPIEDRREDGYILYEFREKRSTSYEVRFFNEQSKEISRIEIRSGHKPEMLVREDGLVELRIVLENAGYMYRVFDTTTGGLSPFFDGPSFVLGRRAVLAERLEDETHIVVRSLPSGDLLASAPVRFAKKTLLAQCILSVEELSDGRIEVRYYASDGWEAQTRIAIP